MPRRSSSSFPDAKTFLTVGGIVAAMVAGYLSMGRSDPFRTSSPFPIKDYLENAETLRGNTYRLEAVIDKTLEYSKGSGRLLSVEIAGGDMLGLLVPNKLASVNTERGQKLIFQVQVAEKGLVVASDIRKP